MGTENGTECGRIRLVDIGKGAGIIGVVISHGAACLVGDNTGGPDPLTQFFYSFLYMFFFLSGYVYGPGRTPKENIIRCAKKLIPVFLICTVVLTTMMWGYLLMLGYDISVEDYLETLRCSLVGILTFQPMSNHDPITYGGLCNISFAFYYLVFLFFASIIFYLLVDKVVDSAKKTVLTVLALLVCEFILLSVLPIHLPYAIEGCVVPAALMILGAFFAKRHVLEDIEVNFMSRRRIVFFLVMLVIAILSVIYIPLTVGLVSSRFGEYGAWSVFTCLITVLSCGYVILTVLAVFERIPVLSTVIEYCGKHSLSILMLHGFYLKMIAALFYPIPEEPIIVPLKTLPEAILVSIAAIILCLLTSYVLTRLLKYLKERHDAGPVQTVTE